MNEQNWEVLYKIVELVMIPFIIYIVRTLSIMSEEMKQLRTILIGADGKNGIRSRVIRLERKLEKLALIQAAGNGKVPDLESNHEDEE